MGDPGGAFVLGGESCLFTLNYAWYHLFFCLGQALLLWYAGRTRHFALAHSFSLFAVLMDYGLGYLVKGTRTITYPGWDGTMDDGMEPLGPIGAFFFFIWFDYAAFGLVVWALDVEDRLNDLFRRGVEPTLQSLLASPVECFSLAIAPVQFWTAPWLSDALGIDDRTLLLSRNSPKTAYMMAVPFFMAVLHVGAGLHKWEIAAIMLSGFGCGCVHHLALFVFGMRGYTDLPALALTLLTEWPALIAGLAVFRRLGHKAVGFFVPSTPTYRVKGTTVFNLVMWAGLLSILGPRLAAIQEEDAITYMIPYIPGAYMQSVGTHYLRMRTCIKPTLGLGEPQLACWDETNDDETMATTTKNPINNGSDFLIMASAAKAGAVLSAKIVAEVGGACGLCVASPERSHAGIPGPVETLPSYDGQMLFGIINMINWPEYAVSQGYADPRLEAEKVGVATAAEGESESDGGGSGLRGQIRCVTTIRDPLSRLKSLYLYARSGGEAWFRYQSGIMQRLQETGNESLEASLTYFWETFGKAYLLQSHNYMMFNLNLGCTPVSMEDFKHDFDGSVRKLLRVWGVREAVVPELVRRLAPADLGRMTEAQRKADPHVTSNKFSPGLVRRVPTTLMESVPGVKELVKQQRRELGL